VEGHAGSPEQKDKRTYAGCNLHLLPLLRISQLSPYVFSWRPTKPKALDALPASSKIRQPCLVPTGLLSPQPTNRTRCNNEMHDTLCLLCFNECALTTRHTHSDTTEPGDHDALCSDHDDHDALCSDHEANAFRHHRTWRP